MSIDPSDGGIQQKIESVLREARAIAQGDVPPFKLENRLLNLGLQEFVDGNITQRHGFPFRFNNQLDEAILALAHFLDRFKSEHGDLKIYAISRVSKGEDRNLAFWQDAKAKLYIELQNMILLLGERSKEPAPPPEVEAKEDEETKNERTKTSEISRIFVFRELSDLAFLTQEGINVLSEQAALGIRIGFVFLDRFQDKTVPLSDGLIIDYSPKPAKPARHNFYELYNLAEELKRPDLPYQEGCTARWFLDETRATSLTFTRVLDIFRNKKLWKTLSPENASGICKFEKRGEFFNDAIVMMYKAFHRSKAEDNYKNPTRFIADRINKTVISRDMIRLHRTMSVFTNAENIMAVDATSVKGSLKTHESRPTYRDWLRRSLNRVLRSPNNSLRRVYILKDHEEDDEIEYQTLLRLLQYYLDYFHYEISDMADTVHRHGSGIYRSDRAAFLSRNWFKEKWTKYPDRIGIYVTTSSILDEFAERVMDDGINKKQYPAMFRKILQDPDGDSTLSESLMMLDYLCTESMIYNFINPRGDTDELQFPAFVYRNFLMNEEQLEHEENILFRFMPRSLRSFRRFQVASRETQLASSILDYADDHKDSLAAEIATHSKTLRILRKEVARGHISAKPIDLLKIRAEFEVKLYNQFRRHFAYLFEVLKFQSVEVKFWDNVDQRLVNDLYPFTIHDKRQDGLSSLQQTIREKVNERLATKEIPKLRDPSSDVTGVIQGFTTDAF